MEEQRGSGGHHAGESYAHFVDWLNVKLMSAIGPPVVGPYGAIVERVGEAVCPVCGHAMAEHSIDHSTPNAILNCPAPPLADPEAALPLSELGMVKRPS